MRILTLLLILFLAIPAFAAGTVETSRIGDTAEVQAAPRYIAWYCTTSWRCPSCLQIEAYAKKAVEEDMSAEVALGRLAFRMVDVQKEPYAHFIQDFQLYSKSLVIAEMAGDKVLRWQNLSRVWELLGNEAAFRSYVRQGISAFIAQGDPH